METRTPKQHIEHIRRETFSIGGKPNPLAGALHQAVNYLSAELYTKDVHFLMELIQNAEDNEYLTGVDPSLEFVITSKDITETGADSTLLLFNNERGFSEKNIDSICNVGGSTKKGKRQRGYIGEKGIGFKSVFLITSQPYIFSSGYQIRFNEEAHPDCNLGYVVPEWVDENPTLSDIQKIYGTDKTLPATTIILPLKSEKVTAVKQQLSSMHPEVMLYLSKIKQLSVREDNDDPQLNTVSAISISSETNFKRMKNIDAESYTLHLSAEEHCKGEENQCIYHMWKQRFPVKLENQIERRKEVEEWVITLAFPFAERLARGMGTPGVYAFLPTEMITNFPFIIQADFILASSRETILLDNVWNKGILDCVSSAFINAFISLVKETGNAPTSSLPPMFKFLPVKTSSFEELNIVREAIRVKVVAENIIPCESFAEQKLFCKPSDVGRLMPAFWDILIKAKEQGVSFQNLISHRTYILNSAFDEAKYDDVLGFLGVGPIDNEWYVKCIRSSNLVLGVSEDLYMELLSFFADNWKIFGKTDIRNIPLLKYIDRNCNQSLSSINNATKTNGNTICFSSNANHVLWLINWNHEFRCAIDRFFFPEGMHKAFRLSPKRETIREWLRRYAGVGCLTVFEYGDLLANAVRNDRKLRNVKKLVIAFTHFLYHSLSEKYLSDREVSQLCGKMPLVDNYGQVTTQWSWVLVPANGSKWAGLLGSNPWGGENYVELSEDYVQEGYFAGLHSSKKQLMKFMEVYIEAFDVPSLFPPDAAFPTVSSSLTKEKMFLLLEWIQNLRSKGVQIPGRFLRCIKKGSWLKTSVGYKPPSETFLSSSDWGSLLQMGSMMVDIPLIDQEFYDYRISYYKEELKTIGVMFEYGEACQFIVDQLMKLANSMRLTSANVLSMLQLIKFMREKYLLPEEFIKSVKCGSWLRTTHGNRSPVGSILYGPEWKAVLEISNPPFIDKEYYGEDILLYKAELQLLGVVVGFDVNCRINIVVNHFKLPVSLTSLSADSVLLILECIRNSGSSNQITKKIKNQRWVKTNLGYQSPANSFLFDPKWGCLMKVVNGMPLIDEQFYGSGIRSYKDELKAVGVFVTLQGVSKAVTLRFKELAKMSSVKKENVLALLACYRHLKEAKCRFPEELFNCILEEKWLQTRSHGFRSPKETILFDSEWESICPITNLPFIDDSKACYGKDIHEYRNELEDFGAVVKFKDGSRFVAAYLSIQNPSRVTSASMLSLLKCIQYLQKQSNALPEEFMRQINKKWLKTHMGYQSPSKCMLFDSKWVSLEHEDGPFIDEAFYGTEIASYRKELNAIGVTVDAENGCPLLAGHLSCHSQSTVIIRVYEYLSRFNWVPDSKEASWIWIPNGSAKGEWVGPKGCVIHDKDNLFGSRLKVLDKYYKNDILGFFSMTLGVSSNPTIEDYCSLWSDWEKTDHKMVYEECCSFWEFVAKHWNSKVEKLLSSSILKVPVKMASEGFRLVDKRDVFIPDDLQLKDLFEKASQEPIFVWYPQQSLPSLSRYRFNKIYSSIGVRTISESVRKAESSASNKIKFEKLDQKYEMLQSSLFRIALGFLSNPSFEMPLEARHQTVKNLLRVELFVSDEPITVSYNLTLSSGKIIRTKAARMIRWDREDSKLFIQKMDKSSGNKSRMEFATYFSEVIAEGLLWAEPDWIAGLRKLIKIGCLLEFKEAAVDFLLKTKNLQVFMEDEEFLKSEFLSA
ncbi:uncharacterized protein LOC131246676 isoform X2 [Magnolia sinica]|uniref:uncharacterized protein LOC131246676 isoform X2 n=1 Tax=Magnolia sinica TaxID=86752 RepID=UPI0026590960|nr:uncharacterized protein LOC131246676 isoform X2 [Magnolia sinica]